jgi:hypothetical protein
MKSFLKTVLPIVIMGAIIFGVTFMSQFTMTDKQKDDAKDASGNQTHPLLAGNTERKFDPLNEEPINRLFNCFFEVGTPDERNRVGFIIRNPRTQPLRMSALVPSCTACTAARAAVIPPKALDDYVTQVAMSSLWSPIPIPSLVPDVAWRNLHKSLTWHTFQFGNAANRFELPAAPSGAEAEQWGLMELGFHMAGPTSLGDKKASFTLSDEKGQLVQAGPFLFTVWCAGREVFEVPFSDFNIGELSTSLPTQTVDAYCLSTTRDNMPVPVMSVGNQDTHVKIGTPVKMTEVELARVSAEGSAKLKTPLYFRCGYRIPLTVSREADGKAMDIGTFEKEIFFAGGEGVVLTKPHRAKINGTVVGLVRLEKGNSIELGTYDSNFALKRDVRLWADRKGVELELIPEKCSPSYLKLSLSKPTTEAERTYWTLSMHIPEREGRQPPWDGVITLSSKAPEVSTVRIQVTGHGR